MLAPVTKELLDLFVQDQQARFDAYLLANGFTSDIHKATHCAEVGSKYARIVRAEVHGSSRSVVCFVDMTTGNIHKADGWKKPATTGKTKGVRGNLHTEDRGASCMSEYGTAYLR